MDIPVFIITVAVWRGSLSVAQPDEEVRFCYECSGFQCLQNPEDPSLFPGRVRCHPVMDYCTTHIRYTPSNHSLAVNASLTPRDYVVTSATRSCAKTWLGNTCRRDWLGKPSITCITTCDRDLCNCDSRSPPPEMFRDGRVLPLAPDRATYSERDTMSCRHMDGLPGFVNGKRYKSVRVDDDDYNYYNDYEVQRKLRHPDGGGGSGRGKVASWRPRRRGYGRHQRNSAAVSCQQTPRYSLLTLAVSVLLFSTVSK